MDTKLKKISAIFKRNSCWTSQVFSSQCLRRDRERWEIHILRDYLAPQSFYDSLGRVVWVGRFFVIECVEVNILIVLLLKVSLNVLSQEVGLHIISYWSLKRILQPRAMQIHVIEIWSIVMVLIVRIIRGCSLTIALWVLVKVRLLYIVVAYVYVLLVHHGLLLRLTRE